MFNSYDYIIKNRLDDIICDLNWKVNDHFVFTYNEVCKKYNITSSTINRIKYKYSDKIFKRNISRGNSKYRIFKDLSSNDIENIAKYFNMEENKRRKYTNKEVCEINNLCIHTLYHLIRKYPNLFKSKRYKPNQIIDGKLECAKCGRIYPLSEYHKDKTAKRGIRNICKYCTNKRQNELLRSKKYANSKLKKQN